VRWAAQSGDALAQADVWQSAARVYNRYKLADSAALATTQAFAVAREAVARSIRAGEPVAEAHARLVLSNLYSNRDSARAERTRAVQLYEAAGAWNLAFEEIGSLGYTWEVGADSATKVAEHARRLRNLADSVANAVDTLIVRGAGVSDNPQALRQFLRAADMARRSHDTFREVGALNSAIERLRILANGPVSTVGDNSALAARDAADSLEVYIRRAVALTQADFQFSSSLGRVAETYRAAGWTDSVIVYRRRSLADDEARDLRQRQSARMTLARALLAAGQTDSAIALGRLARAAVPRDSAPDANIEQLLGEAFDRRGGRDSAAVAYSRAGQSGFLHSSNLRKAAERFLQAALPDSATAVYERLRKLQDEDSFAERDGRRGLARIYQDIGQPALAAREYNALVVAAKGGDDRIGEARAILDLATFWHEEGYADSVRVLVAAAAARLPEQMPRATNPQLEYCSFAAGALSLLRHEFLEADARALLVRVSGCLTPQASRQ